jgi:pimeloyl-ACP methyl ester carboxylesterase
MATRGAARFSLVAEGDQAGLALLLALDHPQAVSSVILIAPTLITAQGRAAAPADEALVARLATLQAPLLALFGTKDTLAPPEAGRHYRDRLASCNVVFVYDAGHAMADERPEAVGELVTDFLHRRDLFLVRQESDLLYR